MVEDESGANPSGLVSVQSLTGENHFLIGDTDAGVGDNDGPIVADMGDDVNQVQSPKVSILNHRKGWHESIPMDETDADNINPSQTEAAFLDMGGGFLVGGDEVKHAKEEDRPEDEEQRYDDGEEAFYRDLDGFTQFGFDFDTDQVDEQVEEQGGLVINVEQQQQFDPANLYAAEVRGVSCDRLTPTPRTLPPRPGNPEVAPRLRIHRS